MITRITRDNAPNYRALYDKAEAALIQAGVIDNDVEINSLEEYFAFIKELTQLDKHFTMLPLDEDVFEIDLNTRQITVPQSFAKNGISVQGDEVAEIVYFKSDRFFDATDLAPDEDDSDDNDIGIYIQWESAAKDENGKAISGVSVPWIIDRDTIPYHILIGWPLSSKITKAAGTIKFSVRFFKYDKDKQKIVYSLSTLAQSVTIKPSLDYDLEQIIPDGSLIDDSTSMIINRIDNTNPSTIEYKAEVPEILAYFVKRDGVNFVKITEEDFELENLRKDAEGFTTEPIYLAISAMSADAGRLTYNWIHRPLNQNGEILPEDITFGENATLEMIVTSDTERITGKLYYELREGTVDSYAIYNGPLVQPDDPSADRIPDPIFEQVSIVPVSDPGTYYVNIVNRVNKASEEANSPICMVPAPQAPIIDADLPERFILRPDSYVGTIAIEAHPEEEDGKLTYQWIRQPIEGEEEQLEPNVEDHDEQYQIVGLVEEQFVADGSYRVKVTNNLNKLQNMVESRWCRVTHAAAVPVVDRDLNTGLNVKFNIASTTGIGITANIPEEAHENRTEDDALIYQWFIYDNAQGQHDIDRAHAEADVTVNRYEGKASDTLITDWEGADGPVLIIPESRFNVVIGQALYCRVTNKYNEDTASICSPFIDIVQ